MAPSETPDPNPPDSPAPSRPDQRDYSFPNRPVRVVSTVFPPEIPEIRYTEHPSGLSTANLVLLALGFSLLLVSYTVAVLSAVPHVSGLFVLFVGYAVLSGLFFCWIRRS
jgi:hypothetical protein